MYSTFTSICSNLLQFAPIYSKFPLHSSAGKSATLRYFPVLYCNLTLFDSVRRSVLLRFSLITTPFYSKFTPSLLHFTPSLLQVYSILLQVYSKFTPSLLQVYSKFTLVYSKFTPSLLKGGTFRTSSARARPSSAGTFMLKLMDIVMNMMDSMLELDPVRIPMDLMLKLPNTVLRLMAFSALIPSQPSTAGRVPPHIQGSWAAST